MRLHHLGGRARLVAALLTAMLSLTLTGPAAANHETNGGDPVLSTPEVWRGWVADEYVDDLGLSNGTLSYARGWWADGDASSLDAKIARYADAYYFFNGDCGDGARQRSETAVVDSNMYGTVQIYPSDPLSAEFGPGYEADEEGLVFNLSGYDNSPEGGGVWHACAYPGEEEYLPIDGHSGHTAGGGRTGAVVDLSAIPTKIAFTRSYSEGGTAIRTVQVCMSRSTIDSDGDGLPDDVDLDAANAAPLGELGVPGGPAAQSIPAQLPGGPSGARGLPTCPLDAPPPNPAELAKKYAPRIYFHSKEEHWPMSIDRFIDRSTLRWSHNAGCDDETVISDPKASRLGTSEIAYKHRAKQGPLKGCDHYGDSWRTTAFTRPRMAKDDWGNGRKGLEKNEGWVLNLKNRSRAGTASTSGSSDTYTGSPIYYEYEPGWIRYYIMYGFSEIPGGTADNDPWCCHEGEWEGFSIKLNSKQEPVRAFLNAHHGGIKVRWADLKKVNGTSHPVLFSAEGAHATYPDTGRWGVNQLIFDVDKFDKTNKGRRWDTWTDTTARVNVKNRSWYGYGGAWGDMTTPNKLPYWLKNFGANFVGPLGPSKYMRSTPFACATTCYPNADVSSWPCTSESGFCAKAP